MSAPALWIGLPLAAAVLLAALYRRPMLTSWIGSLLAGILALLAWRLPIGDSASLGPLEFELTAELNILGRSLTLDNADRPLLAFFFLAAFVWFLASQAAGVHRMFISLGMVIVVLLVAALAVEPFLYAALFIEIAVLISIPLLYPPGSSPGIGVLRYLIFQTMAMPFILFTGWMLTGLEAGSASLSTTVRAGVMLGLGFAFLLAVFPFYTWIPLLVQQVHPFAGGFILFTLPTASLLFGLTFFEQYAWIRTAAGLPTLLTSMGTLMIVTGGVWSMFQTHLGRIFGYAVIIETGFSLLAAGQGSQGGYSSFALLLFPRLVCMVVWALVLSLILKKTNTLDMESLHGIGRTSRILAAGLLAAQLALAGLPLLAGFPVKFNLLALSAASSSTITAWILFGLFGSILAGLRTAYRFYSTGITQPEFSLSRWQIILLAVGIAVIVAMGIFPQAFLPPVGTILQAFQNLVGA